MADYEKLIENIFSKEEKVYGPDEIKELLEQSLLSEKAFSLESLRKYLKQFIQRIEAGQPFKLNDGSEVILSPDVAKKISELGSGLEKIKEIFPKGFPTVDGKTVAMSNLSKEIFTTKPAQVTKTGEVTLAGTTTADFKEGLVCYFYNLFRKSNHLLEVAERLLNKENIKEQLPTDLVSDASLYPKVDKYVKPAIETLNAKAVSEKDKPIFLNAISSVKAIIKFVPSSYIADRGALFNTIRAVAAQITFNSEEDKWNPSDVYFYDPASVSNIKAVVKSASENSNLATEYADEKVIKVGLNDLFSTEKKQPTIIGVSLKEEHSLHGAGKGIISFGTRVGNIRGSDIKTYEINKQSAEILKGAIKPTEKLQKEYESKYHASMNESKKLLESYGIKNIIYNAKDRAALEVDDLNEKIKTLASPKEMQIHFRTLMYVKKYECYEFLRIFLSNFDEIKLFSHSMKGYKNPLLALTAYAVSLSGFNPTFYKVQGHSNGEEGKRTLFIGQDTLKMISKAAYLDDFESYQGFKFSFVSQMSADKQNAKLYQTTLAFRFKGGPNLTVVVYEFNEKSN